MKRKLKNCRNKSKFCIWKQRIQVALDEYKNNLAKFRFTESI